MKLNRRHDVGGELLVVLGDRKAREGCHSVAYAEELADGRRLFPDCFCECERRFRLGSCYEQLHLAVHQPVGAEEGAASESSRAAREFGAGALDFAPPQANSRLEGMEVEDEVEISGVIDNGASGLDRRQCVVPLARVEVGTGRGRVEHRDLRHGTTLFVSHLRLGDKPESFLDLVEHDVRHRERRVRNEVRGFSDVSGVEERDRQFQPRSRLGISTFDHVHCRQSLVGETLRCRVASSDTGRQRASCDGPCCVEVENTSHRFQLRSHAQFAFDLVRRCPGDRGGFLEHLNGAGDVSGIAVDRAHAAGSGELDVVVGRCGQHRRRDLACSVEPPTPRQGLDHPGLHRAQSLPRRRGEFQGPLEQVARCRGRDREHFGASAVEPLDGYNVAVHGATGELPGDLLGRELVSSESSSGGAVQVAPFCRKHAGVHGLPHHVVAKRQPFTVADDQAGLRGFAEVAGDVNDRSIGNGGHFPQREARADEAREPQSR